jgi:uncharacterized protein YjdB
MRGRGLVARSAPVLLVLVGCTSPAGNNEVTVTGYTVTMKTAPPASAQTGTSVPIVFMVTENESDGTTKAASGKSFTGTVTTGGGTVNGASSATVATASDGSASLTWLLGPTAGTQTLRGSVSTTAFLDASVTATPPAVSTVAVTIANPSIVLGTAGDQATAVVKDAGGNVLDGRVVTWQSSNTTVATVNGTGTIITVGVGTSTITATSEGQSGGALLTVTQVPVSTVTTTLATGTITLGTVGDQATAVLQDAGGNVLTGRTVTWQSSNSTVATVSGTGVITTVGVGTSTISATSEGQSGGALLTVNPVPVATVAVTLAANAITLGTIGDQASAVLKDANGNVLQGRTISWQSSNSAAATISTTGVITPVGAGTSTITATSEGMFGTATVTVTVQRIYWTLFDGQPSSPQIASAALPLTAAATVTVVPLSTILRETAGMTFDASGRLWVISYPQGGGIIAAVYALPVTPASTPALIFNLPASGDIDFLSFDHAGNLWASDYGNNLEYMFTPPFTSSRTLTPSITLALPGFTHPSGNAVDAAGNVYVSNLHSTGTNSIAVFTAPVTSASIPAFYLNGLTGPGGLIFDAQGNLYASSQPNDATTKSIVRYNSNNLVSGALPNIVDMTGLGMQNYEAAFAFDALGNLFVADCGGPVINGQGIRSYPTATSAFAPTLAPSATYTNSSITAVGCVWGIAIH